MEFTDYTATDFQLETQRLSETGTLHYITEKEFVEDPKKKNRANIKESWDYDTSFMFKSK